MRTERLFDIDSKMTAFEANVLSCEAREGGEYAAVLDRTAFFPNEGGQACDTGIIGGKKVLSVDECDGIITHILDGELCVGEMVDGEIDFAQRYRKMQDHTAEHIVSGLIHRHFGYENVGFHLGDGYMTADFNGELSEENIAFIETLANEAVYECHPVRAYYPDEKELKMLEYRSKLELTENVRIVEIEGVDMCACCAPHVKNTGEVGLIKIVEAIRYKGGMRLTMLAGRDAHSDYRARLEQIRRISMAISAKQTEVADGVDRLLCDVGMLKGKISELKREIMQQKLDALEYGEESIILFEDSDDMLALRNFVNGAVKKTEKICAVFAGNDENGYKYIIASEKIPLRALSKELTVALGGKGGGSDVMIQGSTPASREHIEAFFKF